MDLQEFVATTLSQIQAGIKQAISENKPTDTYLDGYVSPVVLPQSKDEVWNLNARLVRFDVAVTASEKSGKGGEAKLQVANMFSAGVKGDTSNTNTSVSRVQFEIPVAFPAQQVTRPAHHLTILDV